jgi:uncharacterized protein YijF (DUF1287 family)
MRVVFLLPLALGVLCGCTEKACANSPSATAYDHDPKPTPETPRPGPVVGVADRGIFPDLDDRVAISLPPSTVPENTRVVIDHDKKLLIAYDRGLAVKVYPLGGDAKVKAGSRELAVRGADRAELVRLFSHASVTEAGRATTGGDPDRDGIPTAVDILIGAKKTVLAAAPYVGGYLNLTYPGGDVPRDQGVCTDVVVRAVRNAGLDLQKQVHEDIRRSPKSYPMVKRADANIDHRRVKTILPYFLRHWDQRSAVLDDNKDPYMPGDVVFMDTFPSWSGPDHVGIISDTRGPTGYLLVVNSWAGGYHTAELDLLGWVPVTHRFRAPAN